MNRRTDKTRRNTGSPSRRPNQSSSTRRRESTSTRITLTRRTDFCSWDAATGFVSCWSAIAIARTSARFGSFLPVGRRGWSDPTISEVENEKGIRSYEAEESQEPLRARPQETGHHPSRRGRHLLLQGAGQRDW